MSRGEGTPQGIPLGRLRRTRNSVLVVGPTTKATCYGWVMGPRDDPLSPWTEPDISALIIAHSKNKSIYVPLLGLGLLYYGREIDLLYQADETFAGLLIGSMMGSFFFRGYKKWPMYISGGLGFGMAYMNCENSLNSYLLAMDPKVCNIKKGP